MRKRVNPEYNYKSIFFDNKTIRQRIDYSKPVLPLLTPEIEDVAINSKCYANCSYCYVSALSSGVNYSNVVEKAIQVYEPLKKDRPYQIAIGGNGESTLHPDWVEFVKTVKSLDIVPNYTTNAMHLSDKILQATEDYCGGVAVSYHPHIEKTFHQGIEKLSKINTILNVHIIVGEKDSLENLKKMYEKYRYLVKYFVILPYQSSGRAKKILTDKVFKETFDWVKTVNSKQFAFGALFYPFLQKEDTGLDISIYEPEVYSGFRVFDDSFLELKKSSYDTSKKSSILS